MDAVETESMGWKTFAGTMLAIAGTLNIVDGLVGITRSNYFESVTGTPMNLPITDNVRTWGWVVMIVGVLLVAAGFSVFTGSTWARVVGIAAASINLVVQFTYLAHFPLWSLTMIFLDALVVYGLAVHGGRGAELGMYDQRAVGEANMSRSTTPERDTRTGVMT